MGESYLILAIIVGIGGSVALIVRHSQTRRASDDRLAYWRAFLSHPKHGRKNSKPFDKTTTSRLSALEYEQIRRECYTPTMIAQYDEEETRLINRFAKRAITLQQIFRRQQEGKKLSNEELDFLASEGGREAEAPDIVLQEPISLTAVKYEILDEEMT